MFEWFFGHPEKRAESDYVKFKKKVQDAITDFNDKKFEECKDKFEEALLFLDDLQNKIEKIIDKEESVIEKIKSFEERVRNEILKNNMNLDTIYQIIESSKDNLFKEIDDSKEIIGLIVEGMGDQKEFNEFSNEIIASIDKIKKDLDQIIVYYDFLEFIHLEPEEVEFYIRKGRIGSVIKDEMEIAKFFNKNIIGTNFVYKINKDIKSVQIQDLKLVMVGMSMLH